MWNICINTEKSVNKQSFSCSNLASRATATYHYVHCSMHVNLHVICKTINIVVSSCCSRRQRHGGGAARMLFLLKLVASRGICYLLKNSTK